MKYRDIDIFSQDFTFSVTASKSGFKTKVGATVSILCIVLTLSGFAIFTLDYLNTSSPTVLFRSEIKGESPKVYLRENQIMPVLAIYDGARLFKSEEHLRIITPKVTKIRFDFDPETNIPQSKITEVMDMIGCESQIFDHLDWGGPDVSNYREGGFFLCPEDPDNHDFWTVEGNGSDLPLEEISVTFYPCSLADGLDCASGPEIISKNIIVSSSFYDHDVTNKHNPKIQMISSELSMGSIIPTITTIKKINLKKINIYNEDRDFSAAYKSAEYYSFGKVDSILNFRSGSITCTVQSIQEGQCQPYSLVVFKSGPVVETIHRIYPKLFSTISEFGGFGDLVFISICFFYVFYNNYYYKKMISSQIFSQEHEEQLRKYSEEINLEKKKFEKVKEKFLRESLSGVDLVRKGIMLDGLLQTVLPQEYINVLEFIPIAKLMKENGEGVPKVSLAESIKMVRNDNPKTEIQKKVKKMIASLMPSKKDSIVRSNVVVVSGDRKDYLSPIKKRKVVRMKRRARTLGRKRSTNDQEA